MRRRTGHPLDAPQGITVVDRGEGSSRVGEMAVLPQNFEDV